MMRQTKDNTYRDRIKPVLDKALSLLLIVLLSPLFLLLCLAIVLDDPGPVLFTQKRVGKDKTFFQLHKFRSMKRKTPHDIPTHQLKNPEQYITRVGKFLRKYSLDELPQLFDIFLGNMSFVGPRPALWNQDDLVSERDRYGANAPMPGLTGWAQINGRDELEIPVKARLDGEYTAVLSQGGMKAFRMDMKCFFRTFRSVADAEGVVEGGTGMMHRGREVSVQEGEAGNDHCKEPDLQKQRRILITGINSYIGESFQKYAARYYGNVLETDTISLRGDAWKKASFAGYDTVFHVAGIAHADTGKLSAEQKKHYYDVNTKLALQTAKKAKAEGVSQFILMSSMIIYGEAAPYGRNKVITAETEPAPAGHYGNSKWQADQLISALRSESFRVAVIRAPMIYGPGCKGNYPMLSKLGRKIPVFPNVKNHRSMLYIDNLCEFLSRLVILQKSGVFFPQNAEYSNTAMIVRQIGEEHGKRIMTTPFLNPFVRIASWIPGRTGRLVNKAFGSMVYDSSLSECEGIRYQKYSLRDSIHRTEQKTK